MSCEPCGPNEAIRPERKDLDICNGEAVEASDGVDVRIPVPREKEFGLRNPRKLQDPRLPSKKEVEEHNLSGHMPYRSWCTFCVMGRGKAAPHCKQTRGDGLPELHVDYCFMPTENKPLATILVAKETMSKMIMATVVPMKGASIEFPVKRCFGFLKEMGLENADVVLKSDQENSIMDVLNNVARRRSADSKLEPFEGDGFRTVRPQGRAILEASPKGSSGSNGVIERAVQGVEGQVRTIKLALESRIGVGIPSDHDVLPWIVEYAATIVNKGQVGSDGKTAYERLKGKPAHLSGLEFGERILWKSSVPARGRRNKMDSDWKHGVFLGQRALSGEYMVGPPDGICRPRSIHRRPEEKRWEDVLSLVVGLPWKLSKNHDGIRRCF